MVYPLAFALMGRAAKEKYDSDREDAVDRQARRDREAEERQYLREERQQNREERARMLANRNAVAAAAAPVEPASGEVFQTEVDDEGNPMPANPTAGTFVVDGQRFGDRAAATAAANTPLKTSERVSRAMMSTGDVAGAQALRTSARQERVALQQEADEAFKRSLFNGIQSGGFDGLASALTQSGADGVGGKAQFRAVKTPDGKMVRLEQIDGDRVVGVIGEFPNTQEGAITAGFMLDRGTKPENKLAHLQQERKDREERGDKDRTYNLQVRAQDRADDLARRQLAISQRQLALAERASERGAGGAGGAAAPTLSLKDMREFEDDVHKRLGPEFDPKNAADDAERSRITTARNEVVARASGIFRVNGERGNLVTAEVVLQAMRLAANPANRLERQGNDGLVYPLVVVNGAPVIVGPGTPPRPAQPAQPATPPGVGGAGRPAPQAVAAAPAGPAPVPAQVDPQRAAADRNAAIAQIQQQLAVDDRIKQGGLGGIGARALKEGRMPLGIAARRELEERLAALQQGATQ